MRWMTVLFLFFVFLTGLGAQEAKPRRAWRGPLVLNALQWGAMAADVAGTQHCLHAGTCYEANPLMPTSAGRAWGFNIGLTGTSTLFSVLMHHHHVKGWWALPSEGIGLHTWGAVSGWTK